jgi:HK97 family phage major capsid protein
LDNLTQAVTGGDTPTSSTAEAIGKAVAALDQITEDMKVARKEDTARYDTLADEQKAQAAVLTDLQAKAKEEARDAALTEAIENARDAKAFADQYRSPSKARLIGSPRSGSGKDPEAAKGAFLFGVFQANSRDAQMQAEGKAILAGLRTGQGDPNQGVTTEGKAVLDGIADLPRSDFKAYEHEASWGKATLGSTDATGGWVIPNAVVDEFIAPAAITNIYRRLMTVIPGVTAFAVDIPFRSAVRTRAAIAPFGNTKENLDLAYNGYTATMYTLARIYDIGNQFLRQSRGAAEADVLSELAAAFAQGESYYVREGTGTSQPFGYTPALTNGPAAFRTTGPSLSDSTVAGSIAACISMAAGALAGRGVVATGAVLSATAYWQMLRQGSDSAGFWFATQERNPASVDPGTLISPFGIPVYPDADADLEGTAAVIDNLVVANWKKFKLYFGDSYRVDSSDQAGTRWDTNLTGFRGEEEMGFDARPTVYAGYAQMITDVIP